MMKNGDIEYWASLCQQPQFGLVNESKSKLLDACAKKFGEEVVFGDSLQFELSEEWVKELFKLIDLTVFSSKIQKIQNLGLYVGDKTSLNPIATKVNHNRPFDVDPYFALYLPFIDYRQNIKTGQLKLFKGPDNIFLNNDGHKFASCAYVVKALCHEMIHCFDANYGSLIMQTEVLLNKRYSQEQIDLASHYTPIFKKVWTTMKNEHGIEIPICGDDLDFEEINQLAIKEIQALKESDPNEYEPFVFTDEFKLKYKDIFSFNGPHSACMVFGQKKSRK